MVSLLVDSLQELLLGTLEIVRKISRSLRGLTLDESNPVQEISCPGSLIKIACLTNFVIITPITSTSFFILK